MPIIFEANPKKSLLTQFGEGVAEHAPGAIQDYLLEQKEKKKEDYKSKLIDKENEQVYKDTGIDISNLTTEKSRSATITNLYKQKAEDESINKLLGTGEKKATDIPSLTNPIFSDEGVTEEGNEEVARAMPFYERMDEDQKAKFALKYPQAARIFEQQREYDQKQELADRDFEYTKQKDVEAKAATEASNKRKKFESDRDFAYRTAGPIITSANEARVHLPIRKAALAAMEDAITSGDQSYFSLDNLAEKTGIEAFRTAAGGQYKTASKTFFLGNIGKVGGRPNQYIEQQINDALTKVGRSRAANLKAVELLKLDNDFEEDYINTIDGITEEAEKKEGFVSGNLGSQIAKKTKPFVETRMKDLEKKLKIIDRYEKEIDEMPKGFVFMLDENDQPLYVPDDPNELNEAQMNGAKRL